MVSRVGLRNASRNTASIRAAEALPPAPWAELMKSSRSLGRRRRNASMRSSTMSSRDGVPLPVDPPRISSWRSSPASSGEGSSGRGASANPNRDGGVLGEAAVVVIGGAGTLGGHHARADRRLRGAGGAEHLALPRLDDALEDLAALARLGVGHPHAGHLELQLGVPRRVLLTELQG